MSKIIKALLGIAVTLGLLMPFLLNTALAEGVWYNQTYTEWNEKVNDKSNPNEIFGERYTKAQVQWVMYGFFDFIISSTQNKEIAQCVMTGNLNDCIGIISGILQPPAKQSSSMINEYSKKGLLANIFADRELSGISYFKGIANKLNPVKEVHAQTPGFGFEGLSIIRSLWGITRNVAYGLFILVTIIFAFMIMFRVKISPQVVITVQSSIPKIAIAIVLVTFSYAIAGLLVDLMYVVIGLLSVIMASGFAGTTTIGGSNALSPSTMFFLMTQGPLSLGVFGALFLYFFTFVLVFIIAFFGGGGILGAIVTGAFAVAFSPILITIGIILLIIFILILLWTWLRVLLVLFKAFVQILLLTVFAPIQFLIGTVSPSFGFGTWLKSFVSNLAVFPTTGLMIALAFFFLAQAWNAVWVDFFRQNVITQQGLNAVDDLIGDLIFGVPIVGPALLNSGWPPLLAGGSRFLPLLLTGVSFIIMLMLPKSAELVQSIISGKPFSFGNAIGEGIAGGVPYAGYSLGQLAGGNQPWGTKAVYGGFNAIFRRGQPPITPPGIDATTKKLAGEAYRGGQNRKWW